MVSSDQTGSDPSDAEALHQVELRHPSPAQVQALLAALRARLLSGQLDWVHLETGGRGPAGAVLGQLRRWGLPAGVVQVQRLKPLPTPRDLTGALHLLRLRGQQPGLPPPPRRSPPAPGQLLMVELRGTTTLGSPFHRRLHYDSFSPDYLPQPIAMVNQGQHDADMPTAMAFYTWAATSRSIVRRSLAAPSSFFFGCFDRHAPTPAACGS